MLTKLREFDFWHDSEFSRIPQKLFNTLVCDFAVEQFTHARLRFMKEDFQVLWFELPGASQHRLVQLRLKAQFNRLFWRKTRISEYVAGAQPWILHTSPLRSRAFTSERRFLAVFKSFLGVLDPCFSKQCKTYITLLISEI